MDIFYMTFQKALDKHTHGRMLVKLEALGVEEKSLLCFGNWQAFKLA